MEKQNVYDIEKNTIVDDGSHDDNEGGVSDEGDSDEGVYANAHLSPGRIKNTKIVQTSHNYVAVSRGCNYKKCNLILLIGLICIDLLCCLCLITSIVLFKFVFVVQPIDLVSSNITNTTLQVTNIPTYIPTYNPTQYPTFVPSDSPTYEIPQ